MKHEMHEIYGTQRVEVPTLKLMPSFGRSCLVSAEAGYSIQSSGSPTLSLCLSATCPVHENAFDLRYPQLPRSLVVLGIYYTHYSGESPATNYINSLTLPHSLSVSFDFFDPGYIVVCKQKTRFQSC
jgi:hypothetical protein